VSSKRVFILGPSHHVYLKGCALSQCQEYETPIGSLPLDLNSEWSMRLAMCTEAMVQPSPS
jgi:AmmeMemoRadiSam system protein B